MPSVTVLLTPQIIGMRIFPELEDALRDAVFQVIGDMIPRENIEVNSVYGGETNDVEIIAGISWRRHPEFSPEICESLESESHAAVIACVAKNFPGTKANIRTIATAK